MTQEDKELLLKDLCARLPYHPRVKVWLKDGTTEESALDLEHNYGDVLRDAFYYNKIVKIKPYLRSMSSMTEEEAKELSILCDITGVLSIKITDEYIDFEVDDGFGGIGIKPICYDDIISSIEIFDWLNKNHFDYRGLIEKSLALDETGLNIY